MRPPLLVSRSTSASVIRCAPPSGTGQPTSWPSMASSQPYTAEPASSGDRSVCSAQPAISDRRALTGEHLRAEPARREHQPPGQPQRAGDPRRAHERQAAAHRRERREQRVQQRGREPAPFGVRPQPPLAVGRGEGLHGRRRDPGVAVEHRGATVGQEVGEHVRRVPPAQPVRAEVEGAQHRGREAQRVLRAEQVVEIAGRGDLGRPYGPAGRAGRLQHDDVPARVGQLVRGDEAVVPGPDDHCVGDLHSAHSARSGNVSYGGPSLAP